MHTPYPHLELLAMSEYKPSSERNKKTVTVSSDAELAAIRARVKAKQNG